MSDQPIADRPINRTAPALSRRNALFAGAGAIAGSAAAVVGSRLNSRTDATAPAAGAGAGARLDVPVMIQVANAATGAFDLYVGAEVFRLVDTRFAAQVATAARKARH